MIFGDPLRQSQPQARTVRLGVVRAVSAIEALEDARQMFRSDADPHEVHQLLFVACRTPGRLLVLDGKSGKEIADLPADAGIDDAFYDPATSRIYVIAGSGYINAYEVDDSKYVRAVGTTPTINGAKTGLLVSGQNSLYVGVPGTPDKPSEIRVYSTAVTK